MEDERRTKVECPADGCSGVIKMAVSLPAGEYDCPCKARKVRLSWAIYQDSRGRQPNLTEVPRAGGPQ